MHVGGRVCPASERMEALLGMSSVPVEAYDDVYRALARLAQRNAPRVRALLVCVEPLRAAEMDFFAVVTRRFPDLPVWAYGDGQATWKVEEAIRLGARGRATEDTVWALLQGRPSGIAAPPKPAKPAPRHDGAKVKAPPPAPRVEPVAERRPEERGRIVTDEELDALLNGLPEDHLGRSDAE